MSFVEPVVSWLEQHGAALFFGTTLVLLAGLVAMLASRSPDRRRRLGVLTALGTCLYLVLGAVPLPRVPWPDWSASAPGLDGSPPRGSIHPPAERAAQPADRGVEPASGDAPDALPQVVDPALRAAVLQRALEGVGIDSTALAGAALESAPALPPMPLPAAAARAEIAWPTLLASAYLLGVLLFLLRHLAGKARLRRLLAACREAAPASVPGFTLPHGTRLLLSPQRVRPFCTGVLRPVIVLPDELLEPDRAAEARAVAAHEASHLRAGDSRVSALLALLAIPLYCHPLFWWLCREVRFCNELLADDDAAGPDRNSYARALLDLAEHDQPALAAAGTVAVFHRPSEFYRRIQMLLQRRGSLSSPPSLRSRAMHALAALCFVGTVASLFGAPAAAQDPPDAARRQRESELLDTIAALRAEIRELRTLVQTHNAEPVAPARTPTPPLEATRLFGEMQRADAYRALLDQQPGDSSEAARRRLMSKAEHYVVKNGDSLERIAKRELGDASRMDEIRRLNPEIDPERLRVGQTLLLPGDALLLKLLGRTKDSTVDSDLLQDMARSTAKETGDRFGQGPGAAPAGEPPPPSGSLQPGDLFTYPARPGQNVPRPAAADTAPSPANATEELTSRYLDLLAGIEVAEAVADDSKKLSEAGLRPQLEARKDAVNLRTLKKKFAIVERLLDGEIAATEAEIAWLTQKIEASEAGERAPLTIQCDRARTRLEALRSVK